MQTSEEIIQLYGKLAINSAALECRIKTFYADCNHIDAKIANTKSINLAIERIINVLAELGEFQINIDRLKKCQTLFKKRNTYMHSLLLNNVWEGKYVLENPSLKTKKLKLNFNELKNTVEEMDAYVSLILENTMFFLPQSICTKKKNF